MKPGVQPARGAPRERGVVIPRQASLSGRTLARLIHWGVLSTDLTLRYRFEAAEATRSVVWNRPVIFAIWHNRLALSLVIYRRFVQALSNLRGRRMAAMVSASRDGGMLARTLELFGVEPVRGSSSRRGPQALLEMTSWAEQGYDLALTPDGPRGPRYVVQEGAIAVAAVTQLPIIPVGAQIHWKRQMPSWDRFQLPIPFSPVDVRFGEPVFVERDAPENRRADLRQTLEERLRATALD